MPSCLRSPICRDGWHNDPASFQDQAQTRRASPSQIQNPAIDRLYYWHVCTRGAGAAPYWRSLKSPKCVTLSPSLRSRVNSAKGLARWAEILRFAQDDIIGWAVSVALDSKFTPMGQRPCRSARCPRKTSFSFMLCHRRRRNMKTNAKYETTEQKAFEEGYDRWPTLLDSN